jgi:hypothetical protein
VDDNKIMDMERCYGFIVNKGRTVTNIISTIFYSNAKLSLALSGRGLLLSVICNGGKGGVGR